MNVNNYSEHRPCSAQPAAQRTLLHPASAAAPSPCPPATGTALLPGGRAKTPAKSAGTGIVTVLVTVGGDMMATRQEDHADMNVVMSCCADLAPAPAPAASTAAAAAATRQASPPRAATSGSGPPRKKMFMQPNLVARGAGGRTLKQKLIAIATALELRTGSARDVIGWANVEMELQPAAGTGLVTQANELLRLLGV
jgi:hypothetical protein